MMVSHAQLSLGTAYDIAQWLIRLTALAFVPFKRKATAAAWLLLLFILPVPGLVLFLAIGQPRFPRWRVVRFAQLKPFFAEIAALLRRTQSEAASRNRMADLNERIGGFPAAGGNALELIDDYDEVIRRLVADIDAARRSVRITVYIFADDAVGKQVIDALARAVGRGVRCQVLLDPVGSSKWVRGTLGALQAAGVQTREALPFHWLRGQTRHDMRNHRKLFVIDGAISYAGSQNIVSKNFKPGVVNHELVARCEGPISLALEALIFGDWFLETEQPWPTGLTTPDRRGEATLQLLPSGADYPLEGFETALVWQLHQARTRAIIATPYFIPDESVLSALRTAAVRGVEVDLVVSEVVDQRLVNLAQRSYYEDLLLVGVRIHKFRGFFLHAKNVSIDGTLGIVGSSNVDLRSFQLNEEASLFLLDAASVAALERVQQGYLQNSDPVELSEWRRRSLLVQFAENIARLVSPLL